MCCNVCLHSNYCNLIFFCRCHVCFFFFCIVLSQPNVKVKEAHVLGQISQKFTKEQYRYPNVQVFLLKGACMYVLLRLPPFEPL